MKVLGISANHHDSASCLFVDGKLIAAVQEERFTRKKHEHAFPAASIRYCLEAANLTVADLDLVAFYENSTRQLERQLSAAQGHPILLSRINLNPDRAKTDLQQRLGISCDIVESSHHESHAHAAHFLSGFGDCAILVADGVGEWQTTTLWNMHNGKLDLLEEIIFPHSLGLFYASITAYLGFGVNCDEYKVMGLAGYGNSDACSALEQVFLWGNDFDFELDLNYFDFLGGARMYSDAFTKLLGFPARKPNEPILQHHYDLAAAAQTLLEKAMLRLIRYLAHATKQKALCISGGVAQNCAANRIIAQDKAFEEFFFQPAPGDDGSAIGAAVFALRQIDHTTPIHKCDHLFLGPEIPTSEIVSALTALGITSVIFPTFEETCARAADLLANGEVIGWIQGQAEFGARALGARSILADARNSTIKDKINEKIKFRENFRPFAPAVLEEHVALLFTEAIASPFMTVNALALPNSPIPGAIHIDQTARVQTVSKHDSQPLRRLLEIFFERTGVPAILNTSYNLRGEPMALNETDVLRTFIHSGLDYLFIDRVMISRSGLPERLKEYIRKPMFHEASDDARPAVYTFF